MKASRSIPVSARQSLVAQLQHRVERLEGQKPPGEEPLVSTGSPALDQLLPGGGLKRGSLVEYLSPAAGSGAGTLALAAAREACRHEEGQRALVVVDQSRTFYPPAAAAWGLDLSQTILLHPADSAAELWALDQALRCPGVGAVYATCGRLDVRDFRRLQLAAESGGTLGVLVRPARFRGQPTWADVRWEIRTKDEGRRSALGHWSLVIRHSWRLSVQLLRCRGGPAEQIVELELGEATRTWQAAGKSHAAAHPVPAPAQLADPARPRRA
jgi:protein ImuA